MCMLGRGSGDGIFTDLYITLYPVRTHFTIPQQPPPPAVLHPQLARGPRAGLPQGEADSGGREGAGGARGDAGGGGGGGWGCVWCCVVLWRGYTRAVLTINNNITHHARPPPPYIQATDWALRCASPRRRASRWGRAPAWRFPGAAWRLPTCRCLSTRCVFLVKELDWDVDGCMVVCSCTRARPTTLPETITKHQHTNTQTTRASTKSPPWCWASTCWAPPATT